jgi:microcompartment protein CcmK/EutM
VARKLLVVDRLTPEGQPDGTYWVAVDTVQAGVGDMVLVLDEGNSARQVIQWEDAPVRAVVVGIVDQVTIGS